MPPGKHVPQSLSIIIRVAVFTLTDRAGRKNLVALQAHRG